MSNLLNKVIISGILVFITCSLVIAQDKADAENADYLNCHTTEQEALWRLAHPELTDQISETERQLEEFTRQFVESGNKRTEEYVISVVFHIVHNNGIENISEAQVIDAIRVMNEDFSASNFSVNSVNDAFDDIVADAGIRFALAQRDPDGNCTNGIVRTVNDATNYGSDNLKSISPIWDRSRYLNIWVCRNIESGAAGYSRYPSSVNSGWGALVDGIVVRFDYVGAIEESSNQRSQTLTHEVGHWLNLMHPWGNSNEPGAITNCDIDDAVEDTPTTVGWTTCVVNGTSCGSLDNVENFMEYAYCSKMFTLGQASRMHAALNSSIAQRENLWQVETLASTGVDLEPELCIADFQANRRVVCVGQDISFTDLSYSGVNSRTWIFEGGIPASSEVMNPVVAYPNPGLYTVSILVSDGSNSVTKVETDYIKVLDTAYAVLPFVEGFEELSDFNTSDSDVWFTENSEPTVDWAITDMASYSGSKSAYVRGFVNSDGQSEKLASQTFDLSALTTNAVLSFHYACAKKNNNSNNKLRVWISKDCGETWSLRKNLQGDAIYTVEGFYNDEFIPQDQSEWAEIVISNIVSVFHTTDFRVRFEYLSENGNNIFLDNINLIDLNSLSISQRDVLRSDLMIYPNPANGEIYLDLSSFSSSLMRVRLFDLSGRVVKSESWMSTSGTASKAVDVSEIPSGIYFVELKVEERTYVSKLIINR